VRQRLGTLLFPLLTVVLAFAVAGIAVLFVGSNPLSLYKSLFVGAGLDWPLQYLPGNPLGVDPVFSEINLIGTLVQFTPLVLTGLAVAFAFRCGLFNIGGQGQFWVGTVCGFLVANSVGGLGGLILGAAAGAVGGGLWGGIAGGLKAFRGAHEVISTIMLNWIAIYGLQYLFGIGGPLVDEPSGQPVSETLPDTATYSGVWGTLQPVHAGIFVALAAAVVYWVVLNRTTLGYEVKAVGFNPEAARYGGVSVRRSIVLAMFISGAFAGLAGVGEVLGVSHRIASTDVPASTLGFTGIAVALLGRNTAVGVVLSALLFASLDSGARFLSGDFSPELARSLAQLIQGLIILLVGGEAIVRWLLARRRSTVVIEAPPDLSLPAEANTGAV
jgi:simple sugar transport system permease protein